MRVAYLGLGNLGGPLCDAVIEAGHDVAVFDPYEPAVAPRVAAGARRASSPADASQGADVVIVMVRDDAQATAAVLGPDGVLTAAGPGLAVVLHSTVAPMTVRALHGACAAAGVPFIDVGVSAGSGRRPRAIYAMCGGDPDVIDRVRPVLRAYCRDIVRFGDVGAGMAAKLARNAIRYAIFGAMHEGFALAEAAGLDLDAMAHLYRGTFGTCADDEAVLGRDTMRPLDPDDPAADPERIVSLRAMVTLGWKDLDDAFHLADELGVAMPIAQAAKRAYGPAMGVALEPPAVA
ncbi:MAG TPA: NAD(P)-dependent oxidoreductase [Acidimicrobiales bacterium]|jgi:3-hydroxyisobutyrate dehydrogenase-like beta-hydroxyacid dehydrogenase|nr:NAD(P)-dependent oxidoreductase [Acidimicrobiales bacterium]